MNRSNPLISIIIRTKNEERWIGACLSGVFDQDYKNIEVIIVDNESTDKTLKRVEPFSIRQIVSCKEYLPGKALNLGIKPSQGEFIVCLSGHCIPTDRLWLRNLVDNFKDQTVAGVYGRQEPMSFTPDIDKRDLALVFGLDKKVQIKDSFFHNANSMIRRGLWEKFPFDEKTTNIEDRLWARKVLEAGHHIIYEPAASVYHYHGIHQSGNRQRCQNVVRILEETQEILPKKIDIEKLNIIAMIPVRGKSPLLNGEPLLFFTVQRALESNYIKKVIVSTDDPVTAALASQLGAEAPFLRDPMLSKDYVDIAKVVQVSLEKLENEKIYPDLVVILEITFPFRKKDLLDSMIRKLVENGLDSVVAAKPENKAIWRRDRGQIVQISEGLTPRKFKDPVHIELTGVGCVTYPHFIREGNFLGENIGIYEILDPFSSIEVRHDHDVELASSLVQRYFHS